MDFDLPVDSTLPADGCAGTLVGRAWVPGNPSGPSVSAGRDSGVHDISRAVATCSALANADDPAGLVRGAKGTRLGTLEELLANSLPGRRDPSRPFLLAPVDLQSLKACGVTFAASMLERVI